MINRREEPKSQTAWAYYNCGALIGLARTRRKAIEAVEEHTMEPWTMARDYMEIHKVRVETYRP